MICRHSTILFILDVSCVDAFTMPLLSLWAMLILFPHSSSFPADGPNENSVFCHKSMAQNCRKTSTFWQSLGVIVKMQ